nr:FAD:protein FMN transferase [uncultured Oscillibacter sp.]
MRRFPAYVCLLALLLTGCAAPADPDTAQESIQVIAMDTAMLITTYGERSPAAAYAAEDVIRDLEAKLSRTDPDSAVSRLNASGTLEDPEADLLSVLRQAGRYHRETQGAFDITVAPVVAAWGFAGGEEERVPGEAELRELLKRVDGSAVKAEDGAVTLGPGQSVDLGAITKGYAADRLTQVFNEYEVPRALAELGGNVLAWGDRPDGTPWRVGIQDPARPDDRDALVGVLELVDSFAVTSGSYQRYFEEGGERYHHIIDPATGRPADSGLTSVTVVAGTGAGNGAMCDAYSTALFIMGAEKALEFWRSQLDGTLFSLVLVTEDGRVIVADEIGRFDFIPEEDSGYTYETITKTVS